MSTPPRPAPQASPGATTPLGRMVSPAEFVASEDGKRLFCSVHALRWFFRCHADDLRSAGALVKVNRHDFIVRPEFDEAVIRIAQAKSRTAATRQH